LHASVVLLGAACRLGGDPSPGELSPADTVGSAPREGQPCVEGSPFLELAPEMAKLPLPAASDLASAARRRAGWDAERRRHLCGWGQGDRGGEIHEAVAEAARLDLAAHALDASEARALMASAATRALTAGEAARLRALVGLDPGRGPPKLVRHPQAILPERLPRGRPFRVLVKLSGRARPPPSAGASPPAATSVAASLPPLSPEEDHWPLHVLLVAPELESVGPGGLVQPIELPRAGESSYAPFHLRVRADVRAEEAVVTALFVHQGTMLGRLELRTPIEDGPDPTSYALRRGKPAWMSAPTPGILEMHIYAGESAQVRLLLNAPGRLPQFGEGQLDRSALPSFLQQRYLTLRGVGVVDPVPAARRRTQMRALGVELWKLLPAPAQRYLLEIHGDERAEGLRIYTDIPNFPWELVTPVDDEGRRLDSLGDRFAVGRWHVTQGRRAAVIPPRRLHLREIVGLFPKYQGDEFLPAVARERAAMSVLDGFREVRGQQSLLSGLLSEPPQGILHFSGHGAARPVVGTGSAYVLKLEDGPLSAFELLGL
ncbi:MAG: hypothetical protein AAFU79_28085, partial [Myxococcota bacterium]